MHMSTTLHSSNGCNSIVANARIHLSHLKVFDCFVSHVLVAG